MPWVAKAARLRIPLDDQLANANPACSTNGPISLMWHIPPRATCENDLDNRGKPGSDRHAWRAWVSATDSIPRCEATDSLHECHAELTPDEKTGQSYLGAIGNARPLGDQRALKSKPMTKPCGGASC